jgi:hypothetical protein
VVRTILLPNTGSGTICIYDPKTGDRRLSLARMGELASNAAYLYPGTTRIVVIEVKPSR